MKRLALICAALVSTGAPAAQAATVEVVAQPTLNFPGAGIEYHAAAGEANRLELFSENRTTVRIEDAGAMIVPGTGCRSIDAQTARCYENSGLIGADVSLGDLDDVVNSHTLGLTADGGLGDDRLESAGVIGGTLKGGGGRDVLLGGRNDDTLIDGDTPGRIDSDVMDGRGGADTVSYANRTAPVYVDLATLPPGGEPGERDVLRSVEHATGGDGPDLLLGNDIGFNRLTGGGGDDRLYGRAADDFLYGGPGDDWIWGARDDDLLDGGEGIDHLFGGDGDDGLDGGPDLDFLRGGNGADRLTSGITQCGAGKDTVQPSAELDRIWRDCELAGNALRPRSHYESKTIEFKPNPTHRSGGALGFTAWCPHGDNDELIHLLPIRGRIVLRTAGGSVIGGSKIPRRVTKRCVRKDLYRPSPRIRITATLNRAGRELLALPGHSEIFVAFVGRNVPPHPWTVVVG